MIHNTSCTNGLKVTVIKTDAHSVGICLIGNAGGLQATPGLAHFLEHTVLCATRKYPDFISLANSIDTTGAIRNASTSQEDMRFIFKCLPEHLPQALDFLAEVTTNPLLLESDIIKQKDVITQEINGYQNNLIDSAQKAALKGLYGEEGPGIPVIGTEDGIRAISKKDLAAFHAKAFVAGNFRVAISGKLDVKGTMSLVESTLGRMPAGPSIALSPGHESGSHTGPIQTLERREGAKQSVVSMAWKAPAANHRLTRATSLLRVLMAAGRLSRLWQILRQTNPLTYSTHCFYARYRSFGYFSITAGLASENIEKALAEIRREMKNLSENVISDEDLSRIQNLMRASFLFDLDSPLELATYYASKSLYEDSFVSLEDELEKYQAVTKEDIREAARHIMSQPESVAIIMP